jgi:2-iminobutanoate/2-iminopropanoate deaminase
MMPTLVRPVRRRAGPYPPRTIIEVHRLNGDDICEVEGTFYAPVRK